MRISDWSSDVCSSDLTVQIDRAGDAFRERLSFRIEVAPPDKRSIRRRYFHGHANPILDRLAACAYAFRSEEHTSELQSLMRISYAVFCLKKKIDNNIHLEVFVGSITVLYHEP